jgi:Domain of unknown function (DUF4177)
MSGDRKPEADRRTKPESHRTMHTAQATRWQYTMLTVDVYRFARGPHVDPRQISGNLNQLGGEGWELVSMIDVNAGQGGTCDLVAVFKRPACHAAGEPDR